jgi:hypothetical protein
MVTDWEMATDLGTGMGSETVMDLGTGMDSETVTDSARRTQVRLKELV